MHGGAKGSGAPAGERNGSYRHGMQTKEMRALRAEARAVMAECRAHLNRIADL